jgi:Resolvase, N terminal domain
VITLDAFLADGATGHVKGAIRCQGQKEVNMVATWSVDRLGRSLTDLLGILQGLHDKGVGLYLHQQGLDTSSDAGSTTINQPTTLGLRRQDARGGEKRAQTKHLTLTTLRGAGHQLRAPKRPPEV